MSLDDPWAPFESQDHPTMINQLLILQAYGGHRDHLLPVFSISLYAPPLYCLTPSILSNSDLTTSVVASRVPSDVLVSFFLILSTVFSPFFVADFMLRAIAPSLFVTICLLNFRPLLIPSPSIGTQPIPAKPSVPAFSQEWSLKKSDPAL